MHGVGSRAPASSHMQSRRVTRIPRMARIEEGSAQIEAAVDSPAPWAIAGGARVHCQEADWKTPAKCLPLVSHRSPPSPAGPPAHGDRSRRFAFPVSR